MTAELPRPLPTEQAVPASKRIPADPRHAPGRVSLLNERRKDYGEYAHVIPDLFPVGLTIIVARGGVGKTTLSDQFGLCVAGGVEIGGYKPGPNELGWALTIDREGTTDQAVRRSIRAAPWLSMPTDEAGDPDDRIIYDCEFPGEFYEDRLAELEKRFIDAQALGRPLRYVQIDPMRAFLGPVPRNMNTAQVDSDRLIPLNKLGQQYDCAIVVIAHVNKQGEFSGSEAIRGSCNAMWRLDREITGTEGKLVCLKTRAVRERNWSLTYDRDLGVWSIDEKITPAQACKTGHQRAVLDHIAEYGPAAGAALCAAVAADTGAAVGTVKNALARLAESCLVSRGKDGLWFIDSAQVGKCEVCGLPMTVVQPGQTAHPNCAPPAPVRPALPFAPGIPSDYWIDPPAGPVVEDDGGQLADVIPLPTSPAPVVEDDDQAGGCDVCGLPVTPEDPHPACIPPAPDAPKWPGVRLLTESLRASKLHPRPIPWIAPAGDPRGDGPGRQNRSLIQWQQAALAQPCEHKWRRPGLLDEFGPDRLVVAFDRGQSYPAAASSTPLAPGLLEPHGPIDRNPKELGPASERHKAGVTGLAGVVCLVVPQWDHPGIGHPLGARARPGDLMLTSTASLEGLWKLHDRGLISRPEVVESWLGVRSQGVLENFANTVRAARDQYRDDPAMTAAVKLGSSVALRKLHPVYTQSPHWRPDWRAGMAGEAAFRLWVVALGAVDAGEVCCYLGTVDQVCFLLPDGADPDTWAPAGYKVGRDWGTVKRVPSEFRGDRVDLSGIDPARVTPARRAGHVTVSGPLPLGLWVNRRA